MNTNGFVCPVFKDGEFIGNGFVDGQYFITAGQFFRKDDTFSFCYLVDHHLVYVTKDDLLHFEYGRNRLGIEQDLAIFKATFINLESRLRKIEIDKECLGNLIGYSWNEDSDTIQYDHKFTKLYSKCIGVDYQVKTNCYSTNSSVAVKGNSGSPFVSDGFVLGMVVKSCSSQQERPLYDVLIRSSYIVSVINEIEKKDNVNRMICRSHLF